VKICVVSGSCGRGPGSRRLAALVTGRAIVVIPCPSGINSETGYITGNSGVADVYYHQHRIVSTTTFVEFAWY